MACLILQTFVYWHGLHVVLTMTPLHRLGYILVFSVISGYIDVISLVILGVFMGFMSGNIIHLGMCLADIDDVAKTKPVEYYIVPIVLYFASVLVSQWAVTSCPRWGPWAVSVLAGVCCAFPAVFYALSDGDDNFWCALPLAPSLAFQMVWTNKCLSIMTTMDTGNLQNLAMALTPLLRAKPVPLRPDAKVLPPLTGIVGLCLGSVLGGVVLVGGTRNLFALLLPVACAQLGLLLVLTGHVQCQAAAAPPPTAKADPATGRAGDVADQGQTGTGAKEGIASQALLVETLEANELLPSPDVEPVGSEHTRPTDPSLVPGEDDPRDQPISRSSSGIRVHVIEEGLRALSASTPPPPVPIRLENIVQCGDGDGGDCWGMGKGGNGAADSGRSTKREEGGEGGRDRPNVLANIILRAQADTLDQGPDAQGTGCPAR